MAGFRNRLVHFYDRVTDRELYQVCTKDVADIEVVLGTLLEWLRAHADSIDGGSVAQ